MTAAAFLAAVVLAAGEPVPTGEPAGPQAALGEVAEVVTVDVPVYVVRRDGEPLRGLELADFRLFDDDVPRPISDLEQIDLAVRRPTRAELLSPSGWPAPAGRRRLLLLFDLAFTDPLALARSREAATRLVLTRLYPSDLVGVATLDAEHGVRFLVSFTADRAQVVRAVDTLGVPALLERGPSRDPLRLLVEEPPARRSLVASPGQSSPPSIAVLASALEALAVGSARAERRLAEARAVAWVDGLAELADSLARIDGRKQVVLLGQGFESRLAIGRDPSPEDLEGRREEGWLEHGEAFRVDGADRLGSPTLRRHLRSAVEALRRGDATVFAVDVGGLRSQVATAPSIAEAGAPTQEGGEVLLDLAAATSGEQVHSLDFDQRLAELLAGSTVTYLLRYDPPDLVADGRYHRLRVEADLPSEARSGTRLVFRTGYFAPRGEPEAAELARELLAADAIAAGSPRADLDVAALATPFRLPGGGAYVPIVVEVGGRRLVDGADPSGVRLELFAYVADARGAIVAYATDSVALSLDAAGRETLRGRGVLHFDAVVLPVGDFVVRVLVRDAATGRSAVAAVAATVAAPGVPGLLPPLPVADAKEWLLLRAPLRADETAPVYPFTVAGRSFVPAPRLAAIAGQPLELVLVGYGLAPGGATLEAAFRGAGLVTLEPVAVTIPSADPDGAARVAVTLAIPDGVLAAGRLELTLVDARGQRWPAGL